jgi:hypothetical protein
VNKLPRPRRPVQSIAAEWPSTPEIDGFFWELGPEPSGPTEAEARWAAVILNGDDFHTDQPTPDDVLEQGAGEAMAQDQLERGIRCF